MNKAIKDAMNITLSEIKSDSAGVVTKTPTLFSDYANVSNLDFTEDSVFAKKKGVDSIKFTSNRKATAKFDFEIFDLSILSIALGAKVAVGATDIHRVENHIVTGGKITVKDVPVTGSVVVFSVEGDKRTHIKKLEATVAAKEVTLTGTPAIADNTQVICYYLTRSGEKSKTYTIKSDEFAGMYHLVGESVTKDINGKLTPVEFEIFKACPEGNISLSMGDSVTTISIAFNMFPDEDNEIMVIKEIDTPIA